MHTPCSTPTNHHETCDTAKQQKHYAGYKRHKGAQTQKKEINVSQVHERLNVPSPPNEAFLGYVLYHKNIYLSAYYYIAIKKLG